MTHFSPAVTRLRTSVAESSAEGATMRWLDWGPKVPMEYFALIRIALGLNFLGHALTKIGLGYLASGDVLARYLEGPLRSPFLDPPYRMFLEGAVVHNSATFSVLITLTEA